MNIVLIALDTQRADHLGCYGYPKPTSPFLDGIAERGVLFERCYAPNIPTHPSFTTMLTGKEAITHDIVNIGGGVPIADGVRLLPEILKEHGYVTAAVDSMGRHFPRGFDEYVTYAWDRSVPTVLRKAETVTEKALPVIERLCGQEQPFFLFVHYWDPHTPYLPPPEYTHKFYPEGRDPYALDNHSMDEAWSWEPFRWYFHEWMPGVTDSEYVINLYDGETAYMDEHLRRIFAALEPVQEDTLVIVTADHGEILDEQQGYFDHHGLYEGNVHVPLIFYWPGKLPAGQRVSGFVQNVDLAPTLLDLVGLPDRDAMEGVSLLPPIFGLRDGNYDELYLSEATWEVKRAIRNTRWKLIDSIEQDPHGRPMQELFDLQSDPQEQHNLIDEQPEIARELKRRLDAWVARRLQETGRSVDPLRVQGHCGVRIGMPRPDEVIGPGATPLSQRTHGEAATIPSPEALTVPNELHDQDKGVRLHGYVKDE
ncbi:sulfatase family protein [Dictyobacter aurantiacus]|uniref:Sulfatase n=1 Tax=Dictyobacter aurantiacus TaxID=1936993 RepID=A0A401ZNB0_9CHLR|nr:sulfatase [Dictyobacter aurantiacus]GCE08367.1 sulfatase [Dictyobacter aurantiacus]